MVAGRVVYDDTGQPATRHRIQLIASEALFNARNGLRIPTAITNENGEFSLRRVNPGVYYVVAISADERGSGRQLASVLTRSADSAADAAKLEQFKKDNVRITVDGRNNVEVNLRVSNPHFGTISGTVFDVTRQPAVRAMVHVVNRGNDSVGASVRTDDQGQYKVWGLPAGEYVVSASPPSKATGNGERIIDVQGSPGMTYFPSTLLLRNSPPVIVLPDRDTGNVDVSLMARTLHSLAGTVRMRRDNRPVTNATLRLSVKQITDPSSDTSKAAGVENPMSNYLSSTDKSGHWSFSNVPDGSYRLFVQPTPSEPMKPRFVQVEQDLIVNGNDIEDFSVEVSEGARLSGIVVLEGSNASSQFINITASSYKDHANSIGRIDQAGKFALTAVPTGEIVLSAFAFPQDRFYVKSIEANGLDLMRNNLTLAEGDEITEARIVISTGVGVVTGRVLTQSGDKPVAGINVMLRRISDDKHRLFGGKLTGVTDERGSFTLSAAPGDYLVIAWRPSDGPSAFGNAVNKAEREQGSGVTLSPNGQKQIDIRLP
jgi:hypothetical protein